MAMNSYPKQPQKTSFPKEVKRTPKPKKKVSEPPKYDFDERPIVSYIVKNEQEVKERSDLDSYVKNLSYNRSRLESLRNQEN